MREEREEVVSGGGAGGCVCVCGGVHVHDELA